MSDDTPRRYMKSQKDLIEAIFCGAGIVHDSWEPNKCVYYDGERNSFYHIKNSGVFNWPMDLDDLDELFDEQGNLNYKEFYYYE